MGNASILRLYAMCGASIKASTRAKRGCSAFFDAPARILSCPSKVSSGDIPALLTREAEGRCLLLSGSPAGVKGKICHEEKLQVRRPKLHVHVVIGKREGRGACFESSCSVHVPQNKATHYWCRWLGMHKNTVSRFFSAVLRIEPRG